MQGGELVELSRGELRMFIRSGRGTVTFETFYMVDILQDASSGQCDLYVADLEYDLELRPNGTPYVRKYNVSGKQNMEPSDRDYSTYSEKARRYLVNSAGETFFTASNRNNMKIVYDTQDMYGSNDGFLLCRADMSPARYIVFDKNANSINAFGALGSQIARYDYHLQFLMKLTAEEAESMNEDDVIVFSADHYTTSKNHDSR